MYSWLYLERTKDCVVSPSSLLGMVVVCSPLHRMKLMTVRLIRYTTLLTIVWTVNA